MQRISVRQAIEAALAHHRAGRLREAEAIYRQILQQDPNHPDALQNLGVLAHQAGRNDVAAELILRSIAADPSAPHFHFNLGEVRRATGNLHEAIECYRKAISLDRSLVKAHVEQGGALQALGRFDEAIEAYHNAISLKGDMAEVHSSLASALQSRGRFDEAIECCRKAIALRPDLAGAHNNLGVALHVCGRIEEAVECYRRAIVLKGDFAEAYSNLASAMRDVDRLDEAVEYGRKSIALQPNSALPHSNLGIALQAQGRVGEAIECYRKAISLRPDAVEAHSNLLLAMHYGGGDEAQALYDEHLRWARQHAEPLRKLIKPHANDRNPHRRIRLGYVSADFRQHSVGFFIEPVLAGHDHARFEVICYSSVLRPDATTERLAGYADRFVSILGVCDEEAAERIRRDGVDILVDLAGHTAGSRLRVFACRPAPVQVTYLGHPNTSGLSTMDCRLSDAYADPPGTSERYCTEELIRLSPGFLCYRPPEGSPDVAALPARSRGHVTFGSFNNLAKVTARTIAMWSAILRAVPLSRLLLKAKGLGDASTQQSVRQSFARHGIAPERIEIRGQTGTLREHLAAYEGVDIALDTFPYNGTTTTCEALWMGAPVVTLAGKTHVCRVGLSLLNNVALGDLVAGTAEEYVATAARLAADLDALAQLRSDLRDRLRRSPLTDAPSFTSRLEAAYRGMWERWCAGARGS